MLQTNTFIKTHIRSMAAVVLTLLLAGCAGSGQSRDPIEPVNRAVFRFNEKADENVIKPVAEAYRNTVPAPVKTGVANFFSNIGDASSALNYGLQAQPVPSLYSFARFLLNSTAGVLGVMDVTGENGERRYPQTGFGDTLAVWGWRDSSYLVLPLLGPSTMRDGIGTAANLSFQYGVLGQPSAASNAAINVASGISQREKLLGVDETIKQAALDPYTYVRDVWLQARARKTGDSVPGQSQEDENIDDLMK